MYRFVKNTILLSLIGGLSAWGWTLYQQQESTLIDSPLPELEEVKAQEQVSDPVINEKEPKKQTELDLRIKPRSQADSDNLVSDVPKPDSLTPSNSTSPQSINELLPEKPATQRHFNYGYEGKEDDLYNLKLGIQKDDLNVKFGVQTDKDRNTNVNSVDIEVKLPE